MLHQLTWQEICRMIPKRKTDAQKGDFGRLLCITGSRNMPGACLLSTQAALRGGAGLVTVATAPENPMRLAAAAPEAMWLSLETDENGFLTNSRRNREQLETQLRRANGVLLGCGLGVTDETRQLVRWVLENAACPVVLDADGLNCAVSCIELSRRTGTNWILTPHPGRDGTAHRADNSADTGKPCGNGVSVCGGVSGDTGAERCRNTGGAGRTAGAESHGESGDEPWRQR